MPEGDTIYHAASALHRALAGRVVTRFTSVFPRLTRADTTAPVQGRTIEAVESRGKHLLMRLSGNLLLRTHMRMHGSWHIYRPGERWRRPGHEMRIVIETDAFHAVAFNVPVAELVSATRLANVRAIEQLGPDPLTATFSEDEAVGRLRERSTMEIAEALLDQSAIAGIGNVYKSELLFIARIHPFTAVGRLQEAQLRSLVTLAVRLMRLNAHTGPGTGRRTTGRADPSARLWVYRRVGAPCRRCGTPIERRRQGSHARSTYWCPRCQPCDEAEGRSIIRGSRFTRDSEVPAPADADRDTSADSGSQRHGGGHDAGTE